MIDYFEEKPWECKCGCGQDNISPVLVKKLNVARYHADVPFKINSACRCVTHNQNEGGRVDSAHIATDDEPGEAVDIECRFSQERFKIVGALLKAGIRRIGIAGTFIHADVDEDKPQNVIWKY